MVKVGGRLALGLVATLPLLVPGMWYNHVLTFVLCFCGHVLWEDGRIVMYVKACNTAGVHWLIFWLFLFGFLLSIFYDKVDSSNNKRNGSRHQKVCCF